MNKKKTKSARRITSKARQNDDAAFCSCAALRPEIIERVRGGLSQEKTLRRAAELFKTLGDPTRLKIINALLLAEMCVCDLAALLALTQPAVSHHLKTLRQTQLVKYRRDGKSVYYSLDDEHVGNVFYQGLLHASEASN